MNDEILLCKEWINLEPLYLDTETTGLDYRAEICQIAIIDNAGRVLLDSLVKPVQLIPDAATRIHGISNMDVVNAPSFAELWPAIACTLAGRLVVIYNADYDTRMIQQSAMFHGMGNLHIPGTIVCAMTMYTDYRGEWDSYHRNNRWHKLAVACTQEVVDIDVPLHRAASDCELTRRLVHALAAKPLYQMPAPTDAALVVEADGDIPF